MMMSSVFLLWEVWDMFRWIRSSRGYIFQILRPLVELWLYGILLKI